MVSFFSRKSKADKNSAAKKADEGVVVDKHALAERKRTLTKQPKLKDLQRWELENDRLFGAGPTPFADGSRPSTATSTRSTSNWRSIFKSPAMTSSMVNLAPPQPAGGALRHHASDTNLRPGTALQVAPRTTEPRPGSFSRPFSNRNSNWANPLDVPLAKVPSTPSSPPKRPTTSTGPNSATGSQHFMHQLDFGATAPSKPARAESPKTESPAGSRRSDERAFEHGYPSPPQSDQSDKNSLRAFSPVNVPSLDTNSSSRRSKVPSTLRNLDTTAAKGSLPSPAPSLQRVSDEKPDGPIIRNVRARRDTFAFHQPRRQSFTMEFEEGQRLTSMLSPQEGFVGNFSDFDFGETVSKTTTNESMPRPSQVTGLEKQQDDMAKSPSSIQPPTTSGEKASFASWSMSREFETLAREDSVKSPTLSRTSEDQEQAGSLIDQLPRPPTEIPGRAGRPRGAAGVYPGGQVVSKQSPPVGFQSRFDAGKGTRAPPPRPLRAVDAAAGIAGDRAQTAPLSPASPWDADTRGVSHPLSSPFTRPPLAGDFPSVKGLPRGRQLQPSPMSSPRQKDSGSISTWLGLDRSEPRRSAIPAPLAPLRSNAVSSPTEPSPQTSGKSAAPRIPSQMFAPLQASLSDLDDFGKAFDVDFDARAESPVMGTMPAVRRPQTAGGPGVKRVEAKKAPPRPAPITLPPSAGSGPVSPALMSATEMKFPGNFI